MVEVAAGPSDSATHEKVGPVTTLAPPISSPGVRADVHLLLLSASYGAESAEVKLLSPGSLRPSLLAPGLWGYFSTR